MRFAASTGRKARRALALRAIRLPASEQPMSDGSSPVARIRRHNLLGANYVRAQPGWPLRHEGTDAVLPVTGNAQASDGEALHRLALAGLGLARLAAFQVREDIATGRLSPVLEAFNPNDVEEVHAVFVGQGGYLPMRARAFLDFLADRVNICEH